MLVAPLALVTSLLTAIGLLFSTRTSNQTIFIDDRPENVETARDLGIDAILHTDAPSLARALSERGIAVPV